MNPCPCGYYPDEQRCRCGEARLRHYRSRISGPVLDRMDICVEMPRVEPGDLFSRRKGDGTEEMQKRVRRAREAQKERFCGTSVAYNSQMEPAQLEKFCRLRSTEKAFLKQIFAAFPLSVRAYHKILKTARTIADLEGERDIREPHLSEAVFYRTAAAGYGEGACD